MAQNCGREVDVAVIDYDMPVMNGCVLADYLRARYPNLKVILHSGSVDISESEMSNVHAFVPKGEGVARLLEEVSVLALPIAPLSATTAVMAPEA